MGNTGLSSLRNRRGLAMSVVLGVLVILGIMAGIVLQMVLQDRRLVRRDNAKIQERLLVESALSLVVSKSSEDSLFGIPSWSCERWFEPMLGYAVRVSPWGLFLQAKVTVHSSATDSEMVRFVLGSSRGKDSVPSFGLLGAGGIRLQENADIQGNLWINGLLQQGQYGGSGSGTRDVASWSKVSQLLPATAIADAWFDTLESSWAKQTAIDSSLRQIQSCQITDTLRNVELRCAGTMEIRNKIIENSVVVANRIIMSGRNVVHGSILHARHTLILRGRLESNSQFLSTDSLQVQVDSAKGTGVYYLQGLLDTVFAPKSMGLSNSLLEIGPVHGEGMVVWRGRAVEDRNIHFRTDSTCQWSGSWISLGGIRPRGKLEGLLVAAFVLRVAQEGTIWEGELQDFHLSPGKKNWVGLPWSTHRTSPWVLSVSHAP